MEWLTLPALWGVPTGLLDVWIGYYDQHPDPRREQTGPGAAAVPTELDLAVVEALYEAIADATYCGRCGSKLGRRMHIVPSSRPVAIAASWRLLVMTRCYGWLRHPYSADVTEEAQDLRIGQFAPV